MIEKTEILEFLKEIKPGLKREGVATIALFGSYAKGNAGVFSDIDIAVQFQDDFLQQHDVWEYFEIIRRIKIQVYKRFRRISDVVDLNSSSEMTRQIQAEVIHV